MADTQQADLDEQTDDVGVDWLTHDEAVAMFDASVRRKLGMSTEEFLRRWDAGEFFDVTEETLFGRRLNEIIMMMPIVRPDVLTKPRPRPAR